jgi:S-DNA-T family DNA segregation ATPase FtsK/SpoIIIE
VCPLISSGVVQVWTADPKRMEFAAGRALFTRYEWDPKAMVRLFEDAARVMSDRAGRLAGVTRTHVPTVVEPLIVLNVDELAFLTSYQPDRKLRDRVNSVLPLLLTQGRSVGVAVVAAVQDPRQEVVKYRNLFPVKVALRLDEPSQVDLVLGDGALERGAACHLIPADEETGAGIGYVLVEGDPYPRRFRGAYVADSDVTAMVADYPAPSPAPLPADLPT